MPTEPLPDDRDHNRMIVLAVLGTAGAIAVIGVLVWALFFRVPGGTGRGQADIEPSQETTEATLPAPPASLVTATPDATGSDTATGSTSGSGTPGTGKVAFVRAPKMAFRLGGSIYVAAEDGSGPAAIVRSAEGPYALSPDGKTLALVDAGTLRLVDVASRSARDVGAAEYATPVWAPDSARVYFVRMDASGRGLAEVWRVPAAGVGAEPVRQGLEVAVSPSGRIVVVRPLDAGTISADAASAVFVSEGGSSFREVRLEGQPTAVAALDDRLVIALAGPSGTKLVSMKTDGTDAKQLIGAPPASDTAIWGRISPSPDGKSLAVTATGDDGWSRIRVIGSAGGGGSDLTPRRDGTVLGWTASGDAVLFFEGNPYQGERMSLVRVAPDGTKRRTLVSGAQ